MGKKVLLFILNPFLSGVISLKNIRDGVSYKFLYLWFLIFGAGFCAVNESLDSSRLVDEFFINQNISFDQYLAYLREYFTFESNIKDIYAISVNFWVSRFTDNYHWTYLIYATVFGFFYIKSLKIFLRYEKVSSNFIFYALLFMFCYSNPIFNINGMRFWTMAWIGVYVTLKIVLNKEYYHLLLLLLCPFIHGSFFIWIVLLLITFLTKRFQKVWIALFIASSFVSAVSYLNILQDYSHLLPQFLQNQVYSYTEAERALKIMAGKTSYGADYADFLNVLPNRFLLVLSIILVLNKKYVEVNETGFRLFSVYLPLTTMTNFLSDIPSMGRFQVLTIPLLVILWAINAEKLKKYNNWFCLVPIVYAYSLLYWYRNMVSVTELWLYVFPAPISIIKYLFLK